MNTSDINSLLEKYLNGTSTEQENAALETWYMRYENKNLADVADQVRIEQLDRIRKQVAQYSAPARTYKLWRKIAVAAAAVAAIVIGVYFFNYRGEVASVPRNDVAQNDIAPGKNGATITLANGKVIQLSDAKTGVVIGDDQLKYSDGTALSGLQSHPDVKSGGGMTLTASTARGQTYQFTLPDGTKVWLNADSKISFPSRFPGQERKILLDGEAYFEVAKVVTPLSTEPMPGQPSKPAMLFKVPFFVESKGQTVEVLGTHFNINAYSDERLTTTTLVEGSVRVSAFDVAAGRRTEILKPNQQSIQTSSGGMQVRNVDVSEALDWKNGEFIFKREPLQNIMRRVTRWYDVQIIYENGVDVNETFSGVVSRTKNISEILNLMGLNGQLKFKIEGKKVYVGK